MDEIIDKIASLGACGVAINFMRENFTPENAKELFEKISTHEISNSDWVEWLHFALTKKDNKCGEVNCSVCKRAKTIKLLTFEQMMQCLECEWR